MKMTNLRATIPGPGTGRIVIAGHYDTKIFREFPFVGANDGGSSTAFLIELARVLKARQERNHDRAAVPGWRGIHRRMGDRRRSHVREPVLRRCGTEGRNRAGHVSARCILVNMIGEPQSGNQAGEQLNSGG